MIYLITGASHTGKTKLAQRLLEQLGFPYLSMDHLKMGLIRSGNTNLTVQDDTALTAYLWPIVREMMKTAMENNQNLIVEGCYVPFSWKKDFEEGHLSSIRFICLVMTEDYIDAHFDDILAHSSDIERRLYGAHGTAEEMKRENQFYLNGCQKEDLPVTLITDCYKDAMASLVEYTSYV